MKKSNMFMGYQIIFFLFFLGCQLNALEPWTAAYRHIIDPIQAQKNAHRSMLVFSKDMALPYTQLIFSWNIPRPQKGFFSFFVMARDAQTKQWSTWYKMADWGA